jgi:hypothetical protein
MRRNGLATIRAIGAGALLCAAGAGAQAVLDDMEGGNSINRFGGQWGFSGDFWDKGNSKILSAVDTSVEVPFFKGAYGGGYPDGTGNAAELHFRFGTTKPGTPPNTYDNNVSMSAPLGPDDAVLNLTGAQAVSFYARADRALQVEAVLVTANITDYAYYTALINVTPAWTRFTVKLAAGAGGLTRRPFGTNKPLDLSQATAISWEVNKGRNAAVTEATLWIDDVTLQGYTFVAPEPRGSCLASGCIVPAGSIPKPAALLADFDHGDPNQNALGMPWTFGTAAPMTDVRPSAITAGIDPAAFTLVPAGQGFAGGGGGMIGFSLGENWFTPEGYLQLPSANLSTSLAADAPLDATGATGIYFDYKTTGDVEYVDFKLRTDQLHADNPYAIAFVKLKATAGQWKGALIHWSDFILPNWGAAFKEAEKAMRFDGLENLEWNVTSAKKDVKGSVAIDNVYLAGLSQLPVPASLRRGAKAVPERAPKAEISRSGLELRFQGPAGGHVGILRVTDMAGATLAEQPFVAEGGSGALLLMRWQRPLPRGVYFLRLDSRYTGGRAWSATYPAVVLE